MFNEEILIEFPWPPKTPMKLNASIQQRIGKQHERRNCCATPRYLSTNDPTTVEPGRKGSRNTVEFPANLSLDFRFMFTHTGKRHTFIA